MTTKRTVNWSKIGRKSSSKGKVFERLVAAIYRRLYAEDWQSTRNSGRTDLKGDIYSVDRESGILVECKHRKTWKTGDILKGNSDYLESMGGVMETWLGCNARYPVFHVWRKDEFGLWVATFGKHNGVTPHLAKVVGPDKRVWYLINRSKKFRFISLTQ